MHEAISSTSEKMMGVVVVVVHLVLGWTTATQHKELFGAGVKKHDQSPVMHAQHPAAAAAAAVSACGLLCCVSFLPSATTHHIIGGAWADCCLWLCAATLAELERGLPAATVAKPARFTLRGGCAAA